MRRFGDGYLGDMMGVYDLRYFANNMISTWLLELSRLGSLGYMACFFSNSKRQSLEPMSGDGCRNDFYLHRC
jgi:hypothetical protein